MRARWLPLLIGAAVFFLPARARAAVVEICNNGDTTLNVARAIYSSSLVFGNSYHISGWYEVKAGSCETIYSETDPDSVYLGFTYRDAGGGLRNYIANPERPDNTYQAVSQKFCVGVGVVFDYTTKTKDDDGSCRYGFDYDQLEFSLYFALDTSIGRATYTLTPDSNDQSFPMLGGNADTTAHLLLGDPVHIGDGKWRRADGTLLPSAMIDSQNLPPLLPKRQYSVRQPPVAGLIRQITDTLNGFKTCTDNSYDTTTPVFASRFAMNDNGVAISSHTWSSDQDNKGAAIASLDLANAVVKDMGSCWEIAVSCRGGGFCIQSNNTRSDLWDLFVDTKEQGVAILNALKGIAPYYPDSQGETHPPK